MSDLYVLDTDCFTLFQRGHAEVVAHAAEAVDRLAITIVTVDESLTGWYSRVRQSKTSEQLATAYRGLHKTVDALRQIEVLPYPNSPLRHSDDCVSNSHVSARWTWQLPPSLWSSTQHS